MINDTMIYTGFDILQMYYLARNVSYTCSRWSRSSYYNLIRGVDKTMSIPWII